jgi:hypothetical protein
MKPTQKLHDLGQSLWLDNITRDLVNSGELRQYRDEVKDLYAKGEPFETNDSFRDNHRTRDYAQQRCPILKLAR